MVKRFRDLDVYKGAMSQVMEIFALSKGFPPDERFASDRENGSIKQIAG
ncbi:MAG: four helix bundle protein [Verrucomicrobia bacterium]|nr:four helix bundle protein [Verrucomicrobiota bacterium]